MQIAPSHSVAQRHEAERTPREGAIARGPVRHVRANTGPFATEAEALRQVVTRLGEALHPESIWLFGSRARGDNRPDSDFDLLVITRISDGDAGRDYDRTYAPIRGIGVGCDVVPCRLDDFVVELDDAGSMFSEIARTGKKVFDGRKGQFVPPIG